MAGSAPDRVTGVKGLPALLRADSAALLGEAADPDPIRASCDAHITEVAVRITDFNLVTVPVVDDDDDHLLGMITVDDVLEATVPEGDEHGRARRDRGVGP